MDITIFCPDENFKLSGGILKEIGIGGGKTAIICLANALSMMGNRVRVCGFVEEGSVDGVEYISKERMDILKTDVLIVSSSHKMDLSELGEQNIKAGLMFLWLHGISPIKGMEEYEWDGIICVSHFVKNHFIGISKIPKERFYVIHNGVDKRLFRPYYRLLRRDPYGIVFASHPIKGLDKVIGLVGTLRKETSLNFYLDIYGGYKLWGNDQPELNISSEGVSFKGIIPQSQLIKRLFSYNFMINLYDIPEGFGLIYPQALRAGTISIASNVGGVSEIIRDGYNGFLISEPSETESAINDVKKIITYLIENKRFLNHIRKNAMKYDRGWDDVAKDFLDLFNSKAITSG